MSSRVLLAVLICTVFVECQNRTNGKLTCDIKVSYTNAEKLNQLLNTCQPPHLYCKQSDRYVFIAGKLYDHCFYELKDLMKDENIKCEFESITTNLVYFECRGDLYPNIYTDFLFNLFIFTIFYVCAARLGWFAYSTYRRYQDAKCTKNQSGQDNSQNFLENQSNAPRILLTIRR